MSSPLSPEQQQELVVKIRYGIGLEQLLGAPSGRADTAQYGGSAVALLRRSRHGRMTGGGSRYPAEASTSLLR